MTVKIVTDSTADLPPKVAGEFGIFVVPLLVRFGDETFRDGVEITADEFYTRLQKGPVLPVTSVPSPGVFKEVYEKLAAESKEILSIHLSSKLSGTYEAALTGKREAAGKARIEVIDSGLTAMALGLLAIVAAKAAKAGASLDEIVKLVRESMPGIFLAAALDTLKFLEKGGRIGKAQAMLGSILSIKPLISLGDGEVIPFGKVRTHSKAVERLHELLEQNLPAREIAIVYSTEMGEAEKLVEHAKKLAPGQEVYLARFGSVIGTYVGPGTLAVVLLK